ncbi:hypothetical protein Nmel_001229 [Mimus melanotis]
MDVIKKQGESEAACEATSETAVTIVPDRDLPRSCSSIPCPHTLPKECQGKSPVTTSSSTARSPATPEPPNTYRLHGGH